MTEYTSPEASAPEENVVPLTATEDPLAKAEAEVAALRDQNLRLAAEMENVRKRAEKERQDIAKYAVTGFAKDMLGIADNFRRGLEAIPATIRDDEAIKNLVTGLEATERQLLATFERVGIKKLEPLGLPFDPNMHRVMMEIDVPSSPAGTVVQVLQAGYVIHDRLLREALVGVAKGGGAVPPTKADGTTDSTHIDTQA
jgi:molecular chaperone GrpE